MSSLQETLTSWVDRRIGEMLAAPQMWGSREAVELQTLLLLELRTLVLRPSLEQAEPRRVLDTYMRHLRERFPQAAPAPLFQLMASADESEFVAVLRHFQEQLEASLLEENPFQHHELAIRLTFAEGRPPSATAFTSYYEEFRRATRAIVRPSDQGRSVRSIEQATDFSLEDARVTPKNGQPASVLLLLGAASGQQDFEARDRVRDGLAGFVTMAEWAASDAELGALAVDDVDARTRTAVQALRVVPRRGIQSVSIGGRLIGRAKPIHLQAEQEKRFVEVVGAGSTPEDFAQQDEVRAIDLDRGVLRLGKKPGVTCYVRPDQLESVARVGVQASVVGKRYRPLGGRPFVLVTGLELLSSGDDA